MYFRERYYMYFSLITHSSNVFLFKSHNLENGVSYACISCSTFVLFCSFAIGVKLFQLMPEMSFNYKNKINWCVCLIVPASDAHFLEYSCHLQPEGHRSGAEWEATTVGSHSSGHQHGCGFSAHSLSLTDNLT